MTSPFFNVSDKRKVVLGSKYTIRKLIQRATFWHKNQVDGM